MWTMIATWRMALEGVQKAEQLLNDAANGTQALLTAVKEVEDNPYFKSVGYGGLPNREGTVELDAGFMNGNTLDVGAICGVHNIANPIEVAERLSRREVNTVLAAEGAEQYAKDHGFKLKDMKTERAQILYENRLKETEQKELKPYSGHDTVGVCVLDSSSSIYAGTSTSGLFMKDPGRIGDSPIVGSGFYADSEIGAASATGLGEDMMRGCISYEIVRKVKEGLPVQQACDEAVEELEQRLIKRRGHSGDISVIAVSKDGSWGAATNIHDFSIVVAGDNQPSVVLLVNRIDGKTVIEKASQEWMDAYMAERMKPVYRI